MEERRLTGLDLKVGPLGEHDRLLSLLSDAEGVSRSPFPEHADPRAVWPPRPPHPAGTAGGRTKRPGPGATTAGAAQFSGLGQQLETLAAAQALCDLCLQLAAEDPVEGLLATMQLHLERLEEHRSDPELVLAGTVQACIHLLTLGGYGLPLQTCCLTGDPLEPPLGQWDWRCSLLAEDGFAIDAQPGAAMTLNPSELALLQRLTRAELPRRRDGELMGPPDVWRRLLRVVEIWSRTHLNRTSKALAMLRETLLAGA